MHARSAPTWAIVAISVLATALVGLAAFLAMGRGREPGSSASPPNSEAPASTVTQSLTPAASVTATRTVTVTASPAQPKPSPPRGTVRIAIPSGNYGQGFPAGHCANWLVRLDNETNVEVSRMVFKTTAEFDKISDLTGRSAPTPVPTVIRLSVPPYGSQDVPFQSCVEGPVPTGYELNEAAPATVGIQWVTGYRGSACFGRYC